MALSPELSNIEMDTVGGGKDNSTQVFLTTMFRNRHLMLSFAFTWKTQVCVMEVANLLCAYLGIEHLGSCFL